MCSPLIHSPCCPVRKQKANRLPGLIISLLPPSGSRHQGSCQNFASPIPLIRKFPSRRDKAPQAQASCKISLTRERPQGLISVPRAPWPLHPAPGEVKALAPWNCRGRGDDTAVMMVRKGGGIQRPVSACSGQGLPRVAPRPRGPRRLGDGPVFSRGHWEALWVLYHGMATFPCPSKAAVPPLPCQSLPAQLR